MSDAVIKSAGRVLAILEYFREKRGSATVSEIARHLDAPQSSISMLLRSLVSLGYLDYLADRRTFMPTMRVSLLGDWITASLFDDVPITRIMESINQSTGETVLLGRQNGAWMQYVHVLQATYPIQLHLRAGIERPMTGSAIGRILLSEKEDDEIRGIVRRNNADVEEVRLRVNEAELMEEIACVREQGYAITDGTITPEASVVAMAVVVDENSAPLAMGVGGPIDRMQAKKEEIIALIRRHLERNREA